MRQLLQRIRRFFYNRSPNRDIERLEEFFDKLTELAKQGTIAVQRNPFDRLVQEEVIAMSHTNEQASEHDNTGTVLRSQEHTAQPPETSDPDPEVVVPSEDESIPMDYRVRTVVEADLETGQGE